MKADITRDTFRPEHHYRRVIHQQGRVPLDADLNEAFSIQDHLDRLTAIDVIGRVGVPKGDSFQIALAPTSTDLLLSPGHLYIDGILCELDADAVAIASFPSATSLVVATTTIGSVPLAVGEWIDVFTATATGTFQIAALDPATRTITTTAAGASVISGAGHQVRRRVSYTRQPDDPAPVGITTASTGLSTLALDDGAYVAYLDVWLRHITALEDAALREVALGGPDTTTRARAVWQLRLRKVGDAHATIDCATALPAPPSPRGALAARAKLVPQQTDPCIIDPIAKYRRLSNQLYRVEIHAAGTLGDGTCSFKFSRDNGSVVVHWVPPSASPPSSTKVTVESPGRDAALGFDADQWIELTDDTRELSGTPGTLVQIASVDGEALTLKAGTATDSTDLADFPRNPRVRRWDHVGAATRPVARPPTDNGWVLLEDGVQIRFEPGSYQAGDYWLIPARTINGDVEWPREATTGAPLVRPPLGIDHHYAPLALLDVDHGVIALRDHDCRITFPPLTHICAEDVCVKGTPCGKAYDNVQEAIEDLCQGRDLAYHNQHLHGWGVVCGLQVTCMRLDVATELELPRPRECVELASGYAIDPTGSDIRVDHATDREGVVDLGQMVVDAKIVTRDAAGKLPDTSVSLWIDRDEVLHVEPFDPDHKLGAADLFDGTIWMDFYHHCLQPVVDWIKQQIQGAPGEDGEALVTPAQKRLITILNLLAQLLNPTSGRFVYLSGDPNGDPQRPRLDTEDGILRVLYAGLRALLQSETFCGMFADITLPAYDVVKANLDPATPRPTTIFGKGSHRRIRIDPDGKLAVTCGNGVELHVYDLAAQKLVGVTAFPTAAARVVDVAFRKVLGVRQIIAVANIGQVQDKDSELVLGTLADDGSITWSNSRVTCQLSFVSLASFASDPTRVYGAARGDGIYVIQPDSLPKVPERVGDAFFASGHLVACTIGTGATARPRLIAGGHATVAFPATYTFVRQLDPGTTTAPFDYPTTSEGHDDLLAVSDPANGVDGVFAIVGTGGARRMLRWAFNTVAPAQTVELFDDTELRLAYSARTGHMFVTFEDSCQGRGYRVPETVLKPDRHPLQLGAIAVAARPDGTQFYVLNWLSNTITVIPAVYTGPNGQSLLEPWQSAIDVNKLAAYRAAFLNAFLKTAGRFVQYLKDCFCQRLLVECPDPAGKKVYLADVSFQGGAVWQICNFGRRRYVHSFPTVEYWMSIVPVIPMIKVAVEKFCCSFVAGAFDRLMVTQDVKADRLSLTMMRGAVDTWHAFAVKDKVSSVGGQALLAGTAAITSVSNKLRRPVATAVTANGLGATAVVGQPKTSVLAAMKDRNIAVGEIHEVSGQSASTLARIVVAPPNIPAGSNIDLFVDPAGNVVSYGYAPPQTQGLADVQRGVHDLGASLAARDAQIGQLTAQLDTMKAADTARQVELGNLRTQLGQLQASHDKALVELKTSLDEVRRVAISRPPG